MIHRKKIPICTAIISLMFFPALLLGKEEARPEEKDEPIAEEPSYEVSMPNLLVPTNMDPLHFEFVIQHRFEGALADKPLKNFFGMDKGAVVKLGLRFLMWSKLEVNVSHTFDRHEYEAGLSYAVFIPKIFMKLQLDAQYLNYPYEKTDPDEPYAGILTSPKHKIVNSYYLQLALETYPIAGRIKPVINIGYDGFNNKRIGLGVGLSVKLLSWWYIQGEFFPNFYKSAWKRDESGGLHTYAFGFMFQTPSHNFILMAGNSTQIGTRRMMMGTGTKALHLGFNITKML